MRVIVGVLGVVGSIVQGGLAFVTVLVVVSIAAGGALPRSVFLHITLGMFYLVLAKRELVDG